MSDPGARKTWVHYFPTFEPAPNCGNLKKNWKAPGQKDENTGTKILQDSLDGML